MGSAFPAFSRHEIQFETQFYSATVRQLKMFVRQMCTKVRIRRTNDGLGGENYNVRKCVLLQVECPKFAERLYCLLARADHVVHH
jgi:hypothetical protein